MENQINIYTSIGLVLCLPILLIVASVFSKKNSPGKNFKIVSLILLSCCLVSGIIMHINNKFNIYLWAADMLFMIAAIILAFMFWSVFCWGYTLSMLLCLAAHDAVNTLKDWEGLYTNSDGIRRLTVDRTQVLILLRCATVKDEKIILTQWGHLLGSLLEFIFKCFGIKR